QLWPGEFVDVTLILAVEADALVVPAQAVLTSQQGTYVFIVNGDGSATQQSVTVARTVDSLAVIADGVVPGALVVTDGQLRLTPNAHVDIRGGLGSESAGDRSGEFFRAVHPAPRHDDARDVRHPDVRGDGVPFVAGER